MESARPADAADIAAIEEINQRRRAEVAPERGGAMYLAREAEPQPIRTAVAEAIDDDGAVVVVGTYDGVVLGYGLARIEALRDGSSVAVLSHFMVDSEARGSGIGEAMMNLIIDQVKAAGCRGIDSVALPGDRSTKNFFESFGLKARMLTVHKSFSDQPHSGDPSAHAGA